MGRPVVAELLEEDEPTQSANAPESEGSLLVVATTTELSNPAQTYTLFSNFLIGLFFLPSSELSLPLALTHTHTRIYIYIYVKEEDEREKIYVWVLCVCMKKLCV